MKPDIVGYPIFRVGTWNKLEFTLEDLEQIAATFHELKAVHFVPLKLGHDDPLKDAQLALGWIHDVRVVGDELVADFTDVPKIMKDLIKKKRFRSVSIELALGAEYEGKKIKYLLDAVAILGATQPAVRALPDLNAFLASRASGVDGGGRRVTFKGQVEKKLFTSRNEPGGSKMDDEEVKKLIATAVSAAILPFQTQVDTLHLELTKWKTKFSEEETKRITAETEAKTLKAQFAAVEDETKKTKVKMARKGVTDLLESAVKAKKITPAMRDRATKMFGVDDDTRVVGIDLDEVREFFSLDAEAKTIVNGDASSAAGGGGGREDGDPNRVEKDVFKEVQRRINVARQANASLSYAQAMNAVFSADKALHTEYLNADTPRDIRQASGGN